MYLLRRAWAELRNEVFVLPSRTLVLIWILALLLLPVVYADAYVLRILTMTFIFAIFAASWDLLAGYTGQVNFGHALFFGAGAYTSALLSLKLGISPWATIWAGAAVATLFGFLVGYLCLRLPQGKMHEIFRTAPIRLLKDKCALNDGRHCRIAHNPKLLNH